MSRREKKEVREKARLICYRCFSGKMTKVDLNGCVYIGVWVWEKDTFTTKCNQLEG